MLARACVVLGDCKQKIYSSGVWQFEGDVFVPSGTSGASVMQIFGAAEHATTLMLHVYGGRASTTGGCGSTSCTTSRRGT